MDRLIPYRSLTQPYIFRNQFGTGVNVAPEDAFVVKVYPNPFFHTVYVAFNEVEASRYKVQVLDGMGKEVYSTSYRSDKGANHLELNLGQLDLREGFYFIRMESKERVVIEKLMRLR